MTKKNQPGEMELIFMERVINREGNPEKKEVLIVRERRINKKERVRASAS